jgi:hypothetical protein
MNGYQTKVRNLTVAFCDDATWQRRIVADHEQIKRRLAKERYKERCMQAYYREHVLPHIQGVD